MSLEKFKIYMRDRKEEKRKKEEEQYRHILREIKRERMKKQRQDNAERAQQGVQSAKKFIGRILPPPSRYDPKSIRR